MGLCTGQEASFCPCPTGFQDGNIIPEPTDEVLSGAERITEGQGKKEDAESGQHRPAGAKSRLCSFSPPRGVTRELPKGRPRVSLPGQVGGRTTGALVHRPPSVPDRGEFPPWRHQGRGAGEAGFATGQESAGLKGVLGKGKQGAPWHTLGACAACGGARRARRATLALAAWCQASARGPPPRAPAPVDLTGRAADPHHSGRRARPRPGPKRRGDSSQPLPRRPARDPGVPPSHLPAERRSPQPASVSRSPRAFSRRRPPTAGLRDYGRPAPVSSPAPSPPSRPPSGPRLPRRLQICHSSRLRALAAPRPLAPPTPPV